jgi:hypothetical protein
MVVDRIECNFDKPGGKPFPYVLYRDGLRSPDNRYRCAASVGDRGALRTEN